MQDSDEKWVEAYYITCVKKYKTLDVGYSYRVSGRGNLEFNNADGAQGKTGYGLLITQEKWASKTGNIDYYLTIDELNEYFCSDEEDFARYKRDSKIKEILDEN
jgi:hypothetical protein